MTYTTISDYNVTGGLDRVLSYVAYSLPMFIPMFIFILWCTLTLGIYYGSRRTNPNFNFITAAATGAVICFIITTILAIGGGIIDRLTFSIVLALTVLFAVWDWFSREER